MKTTVYAILGLFLAVPQLAHAQGSLKVLISADMEGIGGVITSMQTSTSGREYEKFRRLMTQEVNAAVEGAYAAGATEVLVVDSHGDAQNIDVELLDARAQLTRGWPRRLGMVHGVDASFDAVVFIGYHAKEGDAGVLAHTFSGAVDLELNGKAASEGSFAAAIAGHFGVPVVFVSGDQVITSDLRRQLGPLETVVVKEAIGLRAATSLHPEEARRQIAAGVERGVRQRANVSPFVLDGPVTLELRWERPVMSEVVSLMRGAERIDGRTNRFTGGDMIEVAEFFEVIHHLRPPA